MVRADAGTGIGFEIRARAKRRVAVDGLAEFYGSRDLAAGLGSPLTMPGTFIISPRSKAIVLCKRRKRASASLRHGQGGGEGGAAIGSASTALVPWDYNTESFSNHKNPTDIQL